MLRVLALLFWVIKGVVHANPLVPCYFIFGDSLSDAGNNNALKTKAKANFYPYGIDFPGGKPTGRFTNGRTAVDVIAQNLGLGLIPPYSTAKGDQVLKGVNYASGAGGILPETGQHLGEVISFENQIRNHKLVSSKIKSMTKDKGYLGKCVYTINMGSNDYINNYFMPEHYNSSKRFKPQQFANLLAAQYLAQLKTLYKSGARKIAVFGLGLVGCTLGQVMRNHPVGLCVSNINLAVQLLNINLAKLVIELNLIFRDAKFTFINIQGMAIGPPQGVLVLNQPCCKLRDDYQCQESGTPCKNRNAHFFWDGYHPTEAVLEIMGSKAFRASSINEANPFDILSLVKYRL